MIFEWERKRLFSTNGAATDPPWASLWGGNETTESLPVILPVVLAQNKDEWQLLPQFAPLFEMAWRLPALDAPKS